MDNLIQISSSDFWQVINAKHQSLGGVYKIIALKDNNRMPINRFLGEDERGVLYIGKATSYLDRVIDLKKSISPDYTGSAHICGRRYKSLPAIAQLFPYENLFIELFPSNDPAGLETKLLNEYRNKFGEVPPLNAV